MSQAVVLIAAHSGNSSVVVVVEVMAGVTLDRDRCILLFVPLVAKIARCLSSLETGGRCTAQTAIPLRDGRSNSNWILGS